MVGERVLQGDGSITEQAARRAAGRYSSAADEWLARFVSEAATPRRFDFPVLGVAAYVRYEGAIPRGHATAPHAGEAPALPVAMQRSSSVESPLTGASQRICASSNRQSSRRRSDRSAAEAAYVKARPLDNTDFVYQWRKQMARQYTIRALNDVRGQMGDNL